MDKPKVIVIVGPTASGKTSLSIDLAKKINGEIISADSMQIYKEMNIGTAKVKKEEMNGINHYLIDCIFPDTRFTVADFKNIAEEKIKLVLDKGKTPIIVGGTGLYIDSLVYGIDFQDIKIDLKYREELNEIAKKDGIQKLYDMAYKIDPKAAEKISINDLKRIIRILEIFKQTNKTKTELELESRVKGVEYDYKIFGINVEREILYERINKRVNSMIEDGLIQEVENLINKYKTFPTAMQGIGYKEVLKYINKTITFEEMIELIKMETRRYAKRQMTWFRKNKNIVWINSLDGNEKNIEFIKNYFDRGD